jgi:hypothetical protein
MSEQLRIWKPVNDLQGRYWLKNLFMANATFNFTFECEQREVRIICMGGLPSYTYTNESYAFNRSFVHLDSKEDVQTIQPWSFYIIENSPYIRRITETSAGVNEMYDLKHYCIIGEDEIIDIIYPTEPIVEVYDNNRFIESSQKNT